MMGSEADVKQEERKEERELVKYLEWQFEDVHTLIIEVIECLERNEHVKHMFVAFKFPCAKVFAVDEIQRN